MPAPIRTPPASRRFGSGLLTRLMTLQRDPAGDDARDHRQHRAERVVGDAARQREGEHADEVHRPDAAAHAEGAGAGPGPAQPPDWRVDHPDEIESATKAARIAIETDIATRPRL